MTLRASYSLIHTRLTGNTNSVFPDLAAGGFSAGTTTGDFNKSAYVDFITNPIDTQYAPFHAPNRPLYQ